MLDDFVFQGSDAQGTLASICFGNIGSLGRLRSIAPSMYSAMQICQPLVEIRLVLLPRQPIYSWCDVTLQRIAPVQQSRHRNMVKSRSDLQQLIASCCFPDTAQAAQHV